MKNALVLILASCLALVACNCRDSSLLPGDRSGDDNREDPSTTYTLLDGTWTLRAFHHNDVVMDVPDDQTYTIDFDGTRAIGKAHCKGYDYGYKVGENNSIGFFDPGPQITLYCGDKSLDNKYYQALESASRYRIEENKLFITYGHETKDVYMLEFVAESKDPGVTEPMRIPAAYGVTWKLDGFESTSDDAVSMQTVPDHKVYTLTFQEGNLSGDADCNHYGAEYRLSGDDGLKVLPIISTEALCDDGGIGKQYYDALQHAISYKMTRTTLRINYGDGKALIYHAEDAPTTATAKPIQLLELALFDPYPGDPFTILDASISENILTLKVQYGGGCRDHEFDLVGPDNLTHEGALRITTYLSHNGNQDMCEALITEERRFDIARLQELQGRWTRQEHGTVEIVINPTFGGEPYVVTYDF